MIVYGEENTLAYYRPQVDGWKYIKDSHNDVQDVIFHKGVFYAVNTYGHLLTVDVSSREAKVSEIKNPLSCYSSWYLTASCGELLIIKEDYNISVHFEVFKLNLDESKWDTVKSVGGRMLFLGNNSSLSLWASDYPGLKINSIYYAREYHNIDMPSVYLTGVFNMEEGTFEQYLDSNKFSAPGFWIEPTLSNTLLIAQNDLEPALKAFEDRLVTKNMAEERAKELCKSVAAILQGANICSFCRITSTVQNAIEEALVHILAPKRPHHIMRGVLAAEAEGKPYFVVFVGVHGVGKSTALAKVASWLRKQQVNVLMAACGTIQSGALEQLQSHAKGLQIEIFEQGNENDPAARAKEAIKEAECNGHNVVLIDTAGTIPDNEPLMKKLSDLIYSNNPDLVLFVGEALVGNDAAVHQLSMFNQKLASFAPSPNARLIDGILLTKFDNINDKVGAAHSMVSISGAPVIFVGCGKSHKDLLDIRSIIKTHLI